MKDPQLAFRVVPEARLLIERSNLVPITIIVTGPSAVPEPATMLLLGTGLTGGVGVISRRRKAQV